MNIKLQKENEILKAKIEDNERKSADHTNSINLLKTLLNEKKDELKRRDFNKDELSNSTLVAAPGTSLSGLA